MRSPHAQASLARLVLQGLLVGLVPPAVTLAVLIAVFGVSRPRGHVGGGLELFYDALGAGLVWLAGLVVVSIRRARMVAGPAYAFARGAAVGAGGLGALLALQLGAGERLHARDLPDLAEHVLLPALAVMTAVGLVSTPLWLVARGRVTPEERAARGREEPWTALRTGGAAVSLAGVALGALLLGLAAWTKLTRSTVSGWWIAPASLVPATLALVLGVRLIRERLADRGRARLFGGCYGAAGASVFLAWLVAERGRADMQLALASLAGVAWIAMAALLAGLCWGRGARS